MGQHSSSVTLRHYGEALEIRKELYGIPIAYGIHGIGVKTMGNVHKGFFRSIDLFPDL